MHLGIPLFKVCLMHQLMPFKTSEPEECFLHDESRRCDESDIFTNDENNAQLNSFKMLKHFGQLKCKGLVLTVSNSEEAASQLESKTKTMEVVDEIMTHNQALSNEISYSDTFLTYMETKKNKKKPNKTQPF